jgi:ERCC4-type nuclease
MRASIHMPILIIEGRWKFTNDGVLMTSGYGKPWTKQQLFSLGMSLRSEGLQLIRSDDMADTAAIVRSYYQWSLKEKHTSVTHRPGPYTEWATPTNEDFQEHLLQGLPGVGPELAKRMREHFGRVPWKWDVTEKDLMQVKGIGKEKAKKMIELFGATETTGEV